MIPRRSRLTDLPGPARPASRHLGAPLLALLALLAACDEAPGSTSLVYDAIDELPEIPEGVVVEATKPLAEPVVADASQCGPRTGRRADGECMFLPTRMTVYGQRVQIPAGKFVRGSVPDNYDGDPGRERPAIRWPGQPPRLAETGGFWIDLTEVTREAYAACVAEGPCSPAVCLDGSDGLPSRKLTAENAAIVPQTCVTHAQARAFCEARDGRLPRELEWEFAARGVDARIYPWGNDLRDEIPRHLGPVGARADSGYFGILGQGGNAWEWVADPYVAEQDFADVLAGEYRERNGPLARSLAAWELAVACGPTPEPGCRADPAKARRFVVKSGRVGTSTGSRADGRGLHVGEETIEGWRAFAQHPALGFRCAQDLSPSDLPLTVPAEPRPVPTTAVDGNLEFYGGVAEAVSQSEARRFCKLLRVDGHTDWRLPTGDEVRRSLKFRGPGPFWTRDGAVAMRESGEAATWSDEPAEPDDALLARCVRELVVGAGAASEGEVAEGE